MTRVAVVLPTRDRPAQLRVAIGCALAQDVEAEVRVVVAEDGAQAGNDRVFAGFGDDDRVQRLTLPPSPGDASAVRHLAVQAVDADWIAYLDDDDVWFPDHLRVLQDAARDSRRPLVCARPVHVTAGGRFEQHVVVPAAGEEAMLMRPVAPTFVLHRPADLHAVGGWPVDDAADPAARLWQELLDDGCAPFVSPLVTALHLPAAGRAGLSDGERAAEQDGWAAPGGDAVEALRHELDRDLYAAAAASMRRALDSAVAVYRDAAARAGVERDDARAALDAMRATRWWRLHDRILARSNALRARTWRRRAVPPSGGAATISRR